MSLAAAVAGLAFGLLVSAVLLYLDSSFGREEDVVRALGVPVLALIPAMTSESERRTKRIGRVLGDVAGTATVLGSVLFVAWVFLRL